jgi:flavorubredoxin
VKAVVVYESLWGNTAAVGRAIAEGIGGDVRALSTAEATEEACADADLIVAGAPLLGFALPTSTMREGIRTNPQHANNPPDLAAPSMREWLSVVPDGRGKCAAYETRIWWSPGSAAKKIAAELAGRGYSSAVKPEKFLVTGTYGPLKEGELERAREWGAQIARSAG